MNLKVSWLLKIYLIVPVLLGIVLFDYFTSGNLKNLLPSTPHNLFIFTVVFQLPHIMASFVTIADKEYFSYYKEKLYISILIAFTLPFILSLNKTLFGFIVVSWTLLHVIGQQVGILGMLLKIKNYKFQIWKWSFTLAVIAGPILSSIPSEIGSPILYSQTFKVIYLILIALITIMSVILHRECNNKIGRLYLLGNCLLGLSAWFFNSFNYIFFSILIFRLIHDITGFVYYIVHDTNRNANKPKNLIYKSLRKIPLPILVLCPVIGMTLAFPLTYFSLNNSLVYNLMTGFVFLHYITESFIWKNGSIHRANIPLS